MANTEIGPGDSFEINPAIYNDATEEMYVFIKFEMPIVNGELLYDFELNPAWVLVEQLDGGSLVFADVGNEEDTVQPLLPGETTIQLVSNMEMKQISNLQYTELENIDIKITAYVIGTDDIDTDPKMSWIQCKSLGDL